MAKFGDKYCWMIKNDPSVCPFIKPGEEHMLNDLEMRIREKCISCEELCNDLVFLSMEKDPTYEVLPIVLDELVKREQKIKKFGKSLEIKEEMFDILFHLSTSLKLVLDVDIILYMGLVAFTAGSSFGFNRAVSLLAHNGKLSGHFAIGPIDQHEALSIWHEISDKKLTLQELLVYSPIVFHKEKEKFRGVLEIMEFSLNEEPFRSVFQSEKSVRISNEERLPGVLRSFYEDTPIWIVPLLSHLRRPLGVILLDNFLTKKELSVEEVKAVDIFAHEISLALERGMTYEELEGKVETLEEANVKLKEHQELITKLRAEAQIGDMVLQLTHSFKNPVIAIAGLARILKKKIQPDLPIYRHTNAILEEAVKLEKTLKDFVAYTKTKYLLDASKIDINKVVELLYREKKSAGRRQDINFHLSLSENLPSVFANEYQVYTCIENIVNNSIEAMTEGGELYITTKTQNGSIAIEVVDTGPGVTEEVMKNLFTPFFTTKDVGSGLGLYTSKEIIEKMGGKISVYCVKDKGCTVTLSLPLSSEKENYE
ncbi:MAG: HAMP domain-containing histidine kinase [Deltaproteobacteria bacterium]|nr:HAMP domain-containing histidine kinase [Deltaproteobacteria bacterium]